MTKVIDSVDFGPGIPCTHDSDLNELMRTIYAYFCYKGYPADLQANIDKVIQIFSKGDCSPADIECLMMNALSTVDMWAFFEGFRACRVFTSGDIFDMFFELLDEENRYEADDDE